MTRVTLAGLTYLPSQDRTFADPRGITHETITTNHRMGVVSLCGRLRDPIRLEDKTLCQIRAFASTVSPEGVDCMTCMVQRARLDAMIEEEHAASGAVRPVVELDVRVTSWG